MQKINSTPHLFYLLLIFVIFSNSYTQDAPLKQNDIYVNILENSGFLLKEQFFFPKENQPFLKKLIKKQLLDSLYGLGSIEHFKFEGRKKYEQHWMGKFSFEVWQFESSKSAKEFFDIIVDCYYGDKIDVTKPPKTWFLYEDKIFYFWTGQYGNRSYIYKARDLIIARRFEGNEIEVL